MEAKICYMCGHYNHQNETCKRVVKMLLVIGDGSGSLDLESLPGIIPSHLEQELAEWIMHYVDAWPGWREVASLRNAHHEVSGCAAREEGTNLSDLVRGVKFDG